MLLWCQPVFLNLQQLSLNWRAGWTTRRYIFSCNGSILLRRSDILWTSLKTVEHGGDRKGSPLSHQTWYGSDIIVLSAYFTTFRFFRPMLRFSSTEMVTHLANRFLIWVSSLMSRLRLFTSTLKSAYVPSGVYGAEYRPSMTSFAIALLLSDSC